MTQPSVLILGSGPSAAYAYCACLSKGIKPEVRSATDPTRARGAFWIKWLPEHLAIREDLAMTKWSITVAGSGDAYGYIKKQWPEVSKDTLLHYNAIGSSFPARRRQEYVFDPDKAIAALWGEESVWSQTPVLEDGQIELLACNYDLVLQTFAPKFTYAGRKLSRVWVCSFKSEQNNSVYSRVGVCLYNGNPDTKWVRFTEAFGEINLEFASEQDAREHKPLLRQNILHESAESSIHWYPNLPPDTVPYFPTYSNSMGKYNIHLIGRFARWDRKLLSHHAYADTLQALESLE